MRVSNQAFEKKFGITAEQRKANKKAYKEWIKSRKAAREAQDQLDLLAVGDRQYQFLVDITDGTDVSLDDILCQY